MQAAAAAVWGCATSSRTRHLLTEIGAVEAVLGMLQKTLTMTVVTAPGPGSVTSSQEAPTQSAERDQLQVGCSCQPFAKDSKHVCALLSSCSLKSSPQPYIVRLLKSSSARQACSLSPSGLPLEHKQLSTTAGLQSCLALATKPPRYNMLSGTSSNKYTLLTAVSHPTRKC